MPAQHTSIMQFHCPQDNQWDIHLDSFMLLTPLHLNSRRSSAQRTSGYWREHRLTSKRGLALPIILDLDAVIGQKRTSTEEPRKTLTAVACLAPGSTGALQRAASTEAAARHLKGRACGAHVSACGHLDAHTVWWTPRGRGEKSTWQRRGTYLDRTRSLALSGNWVLGLFGPRQP
jgi:hypothetical protein